MAREGRAVARPGRIDDGRAQGATGGTGRVGSGLPILVAAAGMWTGILMEEPLSAGMSIAWAAAMMAAGVIVVAGTVLAGRFRGFALWIAIWLAFALLGGGLMGLREARIRGSPLAAMAGESVRVQGFLTSDPRSGAFGWSGTMDVEAVLPAGGSSAEMVRLREAVWLQGRDAPPPARSGDLVEVRGSVASLRGEWGDHLRRTGHSVSLQVGDFDRRGPPRSPLRRAAEALRAVVRSRVEEVLPPREGGLLMGLTLGDTAGADAEVVEDFRATGLSHLTAVSGANVAMFLAPIMGLAALAGLGRKGRLVVGLASLLFFALLTRAEPSVLRATAMAGLALIGVFLGRPRSPAAIVGGAVLILLAIDPSLVYEVGFRLSVAATGGILLLAGPLADRLRILPRALALAAGVTLAAQAAVTPLLLYHFGVVPAVTVPANLLAFAAVGPAMLLGLVAAGAAVLFHPLGVLLGWVARWPLGYLIVLADRLARSPLPSATSPGGGLGELLLGLGAVGAACWWLRSGRRLSKRAAAVVALIVPLFVWSTALRAGPPSALVATFFDVGQGDASVVRSPGGAVVLVDAGPDPHQVATDLSSVGVKHIDLAVATHPHADHIGGFPAVVARYPIGMALEPGCPEESPFRDALLDSMRSAGVPIRYPRQGEVLVVRDVRVEVIGPDRCYAGTDSDANND